MVIDSATLDPPHAYKLLIGSIIPCAIGWISAISKDGVANLAQVAIIRASITLGWTRAAATFGGSLDAQPIRRFTAIHLPLGIDAQRLRHDRL
jgi:hypothetical protein